MSFANPQGTFLKVFSVLLLLILPFSRGDVFALDLKIDLSSDDGRFPVLNKGKSFKKQAQNDDPSTPPPDEDDGSSFDDEDSLLGNASPREKKNEKRPKGAFKKSDFPYLGCLKENVNFWEKIYAEINTYEALVHDRDNLGLIYAKVALPSEFEKREKLSNKLKNRYKNILYSLSEKLSSPKSWSASEKKMAALFPKKQLTRASLKAAAENIRIQSGLKAQFEAGVQRSLTHMSTVFPLIKSSGLPSELIFLPHVESSYNARAASKVGAVGLWQLMPSTMAQLHGRRAVAKRNDPKISTQAALKLLSQNYARTKSWPLSLTAYNHGLNGVMRAVEETQSTDLCAIIENYNSPSFRFASSNFYAQFLAAKRVAGDRYSELAKSSGSRQLLKKTLIKDRVI